MASKKDILKKLKILITRNYSSEEKAYEFFNKNGDEYLERDEVKTLLREAGVNRFISEIAAGQIIAKFDEDGNEKLSWKEFRNAVKMLHNEDTW